MKEDLRTLADRLSALGTEDMRAVAEVVARAFTQRAEIAYNANPSDNGPVAQDYADIAMLFESLAEIGLDLSGIEDDEEDDFIPRSPGKEPRSTGPVGKKNPWEGR